MINCEVSLTITWSKNCVFTNIKTHAARNSDPNADPATQANERTLQIKDAKFI